MQLGGLQKLTLIDYPGKVSATVFTVGCNFRCHFCHNPELVVPSKWTNNLLEEDFFKFLDKRRGKLDGVCITGGEPTIHRDIKNFIEQIKLRGFLVKLDSNGTNPGKLKELLDCKLIDYLAMDIKNSPKKYSITCGKQVDLNKIERSVKLIMNSKVAYEFRTTVVAGIHQEEDFKEIAQWIQGAKKYVLQSYQKNEGKILNKVFMDKLALEKQLDLKVIKEKIDKNIDKVLIRQ